MEVSVSDLYRIIGEQYITIIALEAKVRGLEGEPKLEQSLSAESPATCN